MILKVTKRPATLSNEPKRYYTLLFTVDKNALPATIFFPLLALTWAFTANGRATPEKNNL